MRRLAITLIGAVWLLPLAGSGRAVAVAPEGGRAGGGPPTPAPVPAPAAAGQAEPGAELRVYLMTFSAGSAIYEKFGHNTICVHDPTPSDDAVADRAAFDEWFRSRSGGGEVRRVEPFLPTDKAYHYGAFDFEQENFVWRFLHGRMAYWMESDPADYSALLYAADNRAVLLQELDLPPAGKLEVQRLLEENERPENRGYQYDYYRDNCSTRVRDMIDRGTGGELKRQLGAVPTGTTYRSHTRRLTSRLNAEDLFWFTSFTYVLGHPVDEPLTGWEEAFLPDGLSAHVRNVRIPDEGHGGSADAGGRTRPLVLREIQLAETTRAPVPTVTPRRTGAYGLAGLAVGGAFVGLALLRPKSRGGRIVAALAFTALVVPWALLWGAGATIGTYGWAVTDHAASYRNENLLQTTPLMLPLVVLGPMLAFGRRRGARLAVALGVTGFAASLLGLVLQVLPGFWQHNGEIIALSLPANAGLAAALLVLARRAERTPREAEPAASVSPKNGKPRAAPSRTGERSGAPAWRA